MLYDGAVTLEDGGDYAYAVIEIQGSWEAGKQITLTAGDDVYYAYTGEMEFAQFYGENGDPAWMFGYNEGVWMVGSFTASAGDTVNLKIEIGDLEYDTIFDDDVTLAEDARGEINAEIAFVTPDESEQRLLKLEVDGVDFGTVLTQDSPYTFSEVKTVTIKPIDTDEWIVETPGADESGLGEGTFAFKIGLSKVVIPED